MKEAHRNAHRNGMAPCAARPEDHPYPGPPITDPGHIEAQGHGEQSSPCGGAGRSRSRVVCGAVRILRNPCARALNLLDSVRRCANGKP